MDESNDKEPIGFPVEVEVKRRIAEKEKKDQNKILALEKEIKEKKAKIAKEIKDCEDEIQYKTHDLKNDEVILKGKNDFVGELAKSNELQIRGINLSCAGSRLIKSDPSGYSEKDSWVKHMVKLMQFNLDKSAAEKSLVMANHNNKVSSFGAQVDRCVTNIPLLKKRIRWLKRRIDKLKK